MSGRQRSRMIAAAELLLALAAAVGCVWSWLAASSVAQVQPVIAGEPTKTSVLYDPANLSLSVFLAKVAGVLAVLGIGRLRRSQ